MTETLCRSQAATFPSENGDGWNRAYNNNAKAWIAWIWCGWSVSSVKRQNARAKYDLARILQKLQCLGRNLCILSLRVFGMLCLRVLACDKFVNLCRMMPSPPFISLYKFWSFGNFSCLWRKVKWLKPTCLYWLVLGLPRVGKHCLISVDIACNKRKVPRLNVCKVGKACFMKMAMCPLCHLWIYSLYNAPKVKIKPISIELAFNYGV